MNKLEKLVPGKLFLWPVERFLFIVILLLGIYDFSIVISRNIGFDWFTYTSFFALGCFIIAAGLFYRSSGRSERISLTLTATGLLVLFTIVLSIIGYLLLPLWREPIDPFLVQIDSWFGYSWPDIVEFAGRHSLFNEFTRYAYLSSIPQMALLFIVLGFGGQQKELHVFIFSITVSGMATLTIWALFPAFGTSVLFDISGPIEQSARPLVGSAYGAELLRLGVEGPNYITPRDIEGLVAFPSYHTVMAILAVYSARTTRHVFPIILIINLFVLPGVLIHGGHHLVDVFGGILTACCTIYLARKIVTEKDILPDGIFVPREQNPSFILSRPR